MEWTRTKLIDKGSGALSDAELLDLIVGVDGVGQAILDRFGSYRGMAHQPLWKFSAFKGLGDAKLIRMVASFEIAKRIVDEVIHEFLEPSAKPT